MAGYAKLFGSILQSSIWDAPSDIRCVWITMLALADRDGVVEAAVPGLAHEARVSRATCEQALAIFMAPDPDSRTPDHDGRRIEKCEGGWRLLTYEMHQERKSADDMRSKGAERVRRWRDRHHVTVTPDVTLRNAPSHSVTPPVPSGSAHAHAHADLRAEQITDCAEPGGPAQAPPPVLVFSCTGKVATWELTQAQIDAWAPLYPAVNVLTECRKALGWASSHTSRRKTARGTPAFLTSWLARAQDRGGGGSALPHSRAAGNVQAGLDWLAKKETA